MRQSEKYVKSPYLESQVVELRGALKSLYELLEAHAPVWYTDAHRDKAAAALRALVIEEIPFASVKIAV